MTLVYETERLLVRQWTDSPADLDRVLEIYGTDRVTRWIGMPQPMTDLEQAAASVERWRSFYGQAKGRFGAWAVQVRETGAVVGTVLLKPLPEPSDGTPGRGEVEIGWHLHPDSWGHGYATESAAGALAKGFAEGVDEVYAIAMPDNEPSIAVMRRLGMNPLGRTRRWYDRESECFLIKRPQQNAAPLS
jgi:RimJ/RimL family protein N-acetyltransferase